MEYGGNAAEKSKNVQICIQNVFQAGPNEKDFYAEILNVTFINKSREAITLSGLAVECDGKIHRFGEYQQMLIEKKRTTGNREISRSTWHSDTFLKTGGIGMCAYVGFYDDKRPMYQIAKPVCLYTVYKQRDDQENPCE